MTIKPPSPPYLGPAPHQGGQTNRPITRIVMHCTAGAEPGQVGAARATVATTKRSGVVSSYHYCADAKESVQLVYDSFVAYHCGTNSHSIGYELCCSLADQGRGHWERADHQAMLKVAAADVARLCLAYDVPAVKVSVADLRAGKKGLCGHVDMRDAFGNTTHWDPGPYFPWAAFVALVRAEIARLTKPKEDPVPDPIPGTGLEIVVVSANEQNYPDIPDAQVRADAALLRSLAPAGVPTFYCLQEIGEAADHAAFKQALTGWTEEHGTTPCPIFAPTSVAVVGTKSRKAHGGLARFTPPRFVTTVTVDLDTVELMVGNNHPINRAWNGKETDKRVELLRRIYWGYAYAIDRARVRRGLSNGRVVVFAGDWNRGKVKPLHKRFKWVASHGIDKIGVAAPEGVDVTVVDSGRVNLNSDHDGIWVRLRIVTP